jgi:molecular chaperone Hsp33
VSVPSDDGFTRGLPAESRLWTFMDEPREYALYFLEGQRLIHDLALIHPINGPGLAYFREVVLSIQPLIALLKVGEQLGFYIDSEEPWFRLKIETSHEGHVRCTMLPEGFDEYPEAITGLVRVERRFPSARQPYQSIVRLDEAPLREIVNRVLADSWQVPCATYVSPDADQSAMLHQMPPLKSDDLSRFSPEALRERLEGLIEPMRPLFVRALQEEGEIIEAFAELGFHPLTTRPVVLRCTCTRERVIRGLLMLDDPEEVFEPGETQIEVTCEYCKTRYEIRREDVREGPETVH